MVDWSKVAGVLSRAADTAGETWTSLGDPNRWGSTEQVVVPLSLGLFGTSQLFHVRATDMYSRNWHVIGNVAATNQFWNVSAANLELGLEVSQGVGQSVLVQTFDLRAITDALAPWYVSAPNDGADETVVEKPFVISCAVLGRELNARLVAIARSAVILEDPQTVVATAIVAPLAAGFAL